MLERYNYKVLLQLLDIEEKEIARILNYKTLASYKRTTKNGVIKSLIEFIANKTINTFDNKGFVKPVVSSKNIVPLSVYNDTCEKYQSLFNDNLKTIGKLFGKNEQLKKENEQLKAENKEMFETLQRIDFSL